ncbi:hypothetical protein KCU87_g101, partial [Aureobasidium melanogenum]
MPSSEPLPSCSFFFLFERPISPQRWLASFLTRCFPTCLNGTIPTPPLPWAENNGQAAHYSCIWSKCPSPEDSAYHSASHGQQPSRDQTGVSVRGCLTRLEGYPPSNSEVYKKADDRMLGCLWSLRHSLPLASMSCLFFFSGIGSRLFDVSVFAFPHGLHFPFTDMSSSFPALWGLELVDKCLPDDSVFRFLSGFTGAGLLGRI